MSQSIKIPLTDRPEEDEPTRDKIIDEACASLKGDKETVRQILEDLWDVAIRRAQRDSDLTFQELQRILHYQIRFCKNTCPTRETCHDGSRTPEQEKCPLYEMSQEEDPVEMLTDRETTLRNAILGWLVGLPRQKDGHRYIDTEKYKDLLTMLGIEV